jgi:hypothetical protein
MTVDIVVTESKDSDDTDGSPSPLDEDEEPLDITVRGGSSGCFISLFPSIT